MNYFKGLGKRLLYVIATVLNWLVYIPTLIFFLTFNSVFILCAAPILWVLIGSANLDVLFTKLYNHSNDQLWWRDMEEDPNNFTSLWPLWGSYIQKHYLNKLIKDETVIQEKSRS